MKRKKKLVPGVRYINGRRIDLAAKRAKRKAAKTRTPAATDTQAMARRMAVQRKARSREAKQVKKLLAADGGKDGASLTVDKVIISQKRHEPRIFRARPGTFEWRYGGNRKVTALYHAGSHLSVLWEKAGAADARGIDWLKVGGQGTGGVSDARLGALDKLAQAKQALGYHTMSRLFDYCVEGLTSAEIARKHGKDDERMGAVLENDLHDAAVHFLFIKKARAA